MVADPNLAHWLHYAFEWLALAAAASLYRQQQRAKGGSGLSSPGRFVLLLGALLGAAIGNKAAYWLEMPHLLAHSNGRALLLQGQSVVGGLLGGWVGIELAKLASGWRGPRTGDDFVPAILLGLGIGRIGCFLAGLHDGTYGLPTGLPWGIDFGDGIARHPTQAYECLLAFSLLILWPRWRTLFNDTPGLAFRVLMAGYLVWRLLIDFLKPLPFAYPGGISGIQWLCLFGLALIGAGLIYDQWRRACSNSGRLV